MVNKDKYLNHIRDPEIKKTINKFIDSLRSLRNEYVTVVTDFMNPKEMEYAEIIMKDMPDVPYAIYGMVEDAERQVMLLGYERNMPFQYLSILEISNPSDDVTHQDVLGSVLHLGIERSKVGDIIISDKIYVVVQNTICDFLLAEWKKIRRHRIEVRMAEEKKIPYSDVEYETTTVIVSSCRLDGLIHAVCHIPRSKAGDMIRAGMVKVNYEQVTSRSLAVPDQSLISVRRWGRFIFEKVLQETKKKKLLVRIKRMKKK